MDATTSAEDPDFTNDDVWACLLDGDDSDTLSDGCVRVMTLKDGNAEFTGIQFLADGKSFLIHCSIAPRMDVPCRTRRI